MTDGFKNTLIWLFASTVGVVMSMTAVSASYVDGIYLPVSNDSFYHARRILEAVADPSRFYEFDPFIHIPEGSWITWPWFYDFFMAQQVRLIMAVTGSSYPTPILMYLPVAWIFVNIGLFLLICRTLGLQGLLVVIGCLAIALSPLLQTLHGVGVIDHHFMEFCVILGALLAGIHWFRHSESVPQGILLGMTLGIAQGIHNAHFVLLVPVFAGILLLWAKGRIFSGRALVSVGGSYFIVTLALLLGSEPFLRGFYEYYYLSYFHLYVASAALILAIAIAGRPFSIPAAVFLGLLLLLLAVPALEPIVSVKGFFNKEVLRLDSVIEMRSPWAVIIERPSTWLFDFYSLLFVLSPLVWIGALVAIVRSRRPDLIYFSVFAIFGLTLAFAQLRMQYFGLAFIVLGPLLFLDRLGVVFARFRRVTEFLALAAFAVIFSFPVSNRLFAELPLGLDAYYGLIFPVFPILQEHCRRDPGVVLAYNDAGHYIRYHTDCSVIANNFLLTQQHHVKIQELDRLFSVSATELISNRPDIKYILVAFPTIFFWDEETGESIAPSREVVMELNRAAPLMVELLLEDKYEDLGLTLLGERHMSTDGDRFPVVRLFEISERSDGN